MAYGVILDLRYGGFQGGSQPTRFAHLGAADVVNSNYLDLPRLFENLIEPDDVIVDVGCGRGRVINWLLAQRVSNQIIGVELDPDVAARTRDRLAKYANVTIVTGNILDEVPRHGTIFYLYSPFKGPVAEAFREQLATLDHGCTIVYYNCACIDVFQDDPRFAITMIDISTNEFDSARIRYEPADEHSR